jgi:hypothetical protein
MTTMESMLLLARESTQVKEPIAPVNDLAVMLCESQYFAMFNGFIRDGCRQLLRSNPDIFAAAISEILATEAHVFSPHAIKLAYFDFAKEVNMCSYLCYILLPLLICFVCTICDLQNCENKFEVCSKNTFRSFPKLSDRLVFSSVVYFYLFISETNLLFEHIII